MGGVQAGSARAGARATHALPLSARVRTRLPAEAKIACGKFNSSESEKTVWESMTSIIEFGEQRDGYSLRIVNERAVRASAGILFLFALVSFMNAWLQGNFQPARIFVVAFLVDFTIRIFVNPRWAPSLIIGQWFVRNQQPEFTGAPQKRFAWSIGFVLALIMLYLVVIKSVIGPVNLIVCGTCLVLLFFESAFGICLGCEVYNLFNRNQAQLCPGNVCEYTPPPHAGGTIAHAVVIVAFLALVSAVAVWMPGGTPRSRDLPGSPVPALQANLDPAEVERCKVPEFAKAMGHEELWKVHNHCK